MASFIRVLLRPARIGNREGNGVGGLIAEPANDIRRRQARRDPECLDPASVRLDDLSADDFIVAISPSLDQNVGLQGFQDGMGCVLVEDDDIVHGLQRGQHLGAIALIENRAIGGFTQTADAVVAVDGDDQAVPFAGRFLQIGNVPGMEQIEAAVRQHDLLADLLAGRDLLLQFEKRADFAAAAPRRSADPSGSRAG